MPKEFSYEEQAECFRKSIYSGRLQSLCTQEELIEEVVLLLLAKDGNVVAEAALLAEKADMEYESIMDWARHDLIIGTPEKDVIEHLEKTFERPLYMADYIILWKHQ